MKTKWTLLFLACVFSTPIHAKRLARVFPINTPSGWTPAGTGQCWGGFNHRYDFVNISPYEQNVTIRVKDVRIHFGSCDGIGKLSGNWTNNGASNPHCWGSPIMKLADETIIQRIPANSSVAVTLGMVCRVLRSGVGNCGNSNRINAGNLTTDMTSTIMHEAIGTVEIEVAEDRGALITNISASPHFQCAEPANRTSFNIPVNGGRPY